MDALYGGNNTLSSEIRARQKAPILQAVFCARPCFPACVHGILYKRAAILCICGKRFF
jgi:hypothetical protein